MDPGEHTSPEDDLQGIRILIKTSLGALAGRHSAAIFGADSVALRVHTNPARSISAVIIGVVTGQVL